MKKKILSLLLVFMLAMNSCLSVAAAEARTTNYRDLQTSGGANGYITVRFRCTCVQDSIPTNYSWSSSITPPSGISGLSYYQNGAITKSDQKQDAFSTYEKSYAKTYQNALIGGYAYIM